MYQWTHTEAQIMSLANTPGKLDKTAAWPHSSTSTLCKGPANMHKVTQAECPTIGNTFDKFLEIKILHLFTVVEAQTVLNEAMSTKEVPDRLYRKCNELLDSSDTSSYPYDKKTPDMALQCQKNAQDIAKETEEVVLCHECSKQICQKKTEIVLCDKETQVDDKELEKSLCFQQPAPPPPPPPPSSDLKCEPTSKVFIPLPPPPPKCPPSTASATPMPPPPPPLDLNTSAIPHPPPSDTLKSTTPAPLPNPSESGWFHQSCRKLYIRFKYKSILIYFYITYV